MGFRLGFNWKLIQSGMSDMCPSGAHYIIPKHTLLINQGQLLKCIKVPFCSVIDFIKLNRRSLSSLVGGLLLNYHCKLPTIFNFIH